MDRIDELIEKLNYYAEKFENFEIPPLHAVTTKVYKESTTIMASTLREVAGILKEYKELKKKKTMKELYDSLDVKERDELYRILWSDYVYADVEGRLEEKGIEDEDNVIKDNVVERYVYQGRYDCNLSYWDNIDNLIDSEV